MIKKETQKPRGNPAKLRPFDNTEEGRARASAAGKKGGKNAGISKRRKKLMRDSLDILCDLTLKSGKYDTIEDMKAFTDLKNKNITVEQAMLVKQISKALNGDTQSLIFIRDTLGQKPVDEKKVEANGEGLGLLAEIVGQITDD